VTVDSALSSDQQQIRDAVLQLCGQFDDSYWLDCDRKGEFPHAFRRAMAEGGWLGIAMPEEYGGSGLGITEAAVMLEAIAEAGGAMTSAASVHVDIFGLNPVVVLGTEAQKQRMLPPLIAGEDKACFAVTEPNVGINTTELKTRAIKQGDHYVVHGEKIWITTAQEANKILLLARTTPKEEVTKKTGGLTLFYTDLDRAKVQIKKIQKLGRHAVDSNMLFFDGLEIPEEDRIGEEGEGFAAILHGMNPERVLIAACAVGVGRLAIDRGARYARERIVFDRPIGMNQSIAHPLAKCWTEIEAAWLMTLHAGRLYDARQKCGAEANSAKYLAAEAAFSACETAVMTHGGMGYAQEYHVERYYREVLIPRIGPISPHMILNYISERVLDLPKSY